LATSIGLRNPEVKALAVPAANHSFINVFAVEEEEEEEEEDEEGEEEEEEEEEGGEEF
jgi:hypothetical protein